MTMTIEQIEKKFKSLGRQICCLSTTIEVTLIQAQALVTTNTLKVGSTYFITDKGLYLPAITTNKFGEGIRVMMCPATYLEDGFIDAYGNVWWGGYNSTASYTANDLVIWGGKVWKNVAGNTGGIFDDATLTADWELIDPETFSNHEYVELTFGVRYDIGNTWIEKQWDTNGNEFGVSFEENNTYFGFQYNPCDISDWNLGAYNNHNFFNNKNVGIFNNYFANGANIQFNSGNLQYITRNICGASVSIVNNTNKGYIQENTINGGIYDNSNWGNIESNQCGEGIHNNSNRGNISNNSNTFSIYFNKNIGNISGNTNTGYINENANIGDINGNGCTSNGTISHNINTGEISNNNNDGDDGPAIHKNSNLGAIKNNIVSTRVVTWNSNLGEISNNELDEGSISFNSNNGNISANLVSGNIVNNSNNGSISSLGDIVVNVQFNINNGAISTTVVGDISDAIVNK